MSIVSGYYYGGIIMTGSLQIKNGYFYAVLNFKDKEGKRKQKWVATELQERGNKRKAEQVLKDLIAEYEGSDYIEPSKKLFCDFLKEWVEMDKHNVQVTTYDGYVHMLNKHIYPYFKEKGIMLSKIKPMDIQKYYSVKLDEGLSPNTVIKHHGIIRTSLQYAVKTNLIKENIADLVDKPKKERYYASHYNLDELNELFAIAKGTTIEPCIVIASFFGLRRSEVLGVKWESIDFENKLIKICNKVVRGKDKNGKLTSIELDKMKSETSLRTLPLCDTMLEYFRKVLEQQKINAQIMGNSYIHKYDNYICVNAMGDLIKPDYVSDTFNALLKKNGLRHIRYHDLRHSCASLLVSLGFNLVEIQQWLGHADFRITANTYSHVDMKEKFRMVDCLEKNLTL